MQKLLKTTATDITVCMYVCMYVCMHAVMPDEFLEKVAAAKQADEMDRLDRLSQLRDEDRARLANQRLQREKVRSVYTIRYLDRL